MNLFVKSALVISVFLGGWAHAGAFLEENGVALARFDPLSYFSPDRQLIYGDQQRAFDYKGSKFYFITNAHLDAFKADPEHFAPQFGGYDAYAASQGSKVVPNPRVFIIHDGKLYLFRDRESLRRWKEDAAGNIERANQTWAG
jgi:hypothetical protein